MTVKSLFLTIVLAFFSFANDITAQSTTQSVNLTWKHTQISQSEYSQPEKVMYFEQSGYNESRVPIYTTQFKISDGDPKFTITNLKYESFDGEYIEGYSASLSSNFEVKSFIAYENKQPYAVVEVVPIRFNANTNKAERLTSFDLQLSVRPATARYKRNKRTDWNTTSVLATGDWYKIRTNQEGIHVINASFLEGMGINPADVPLNTFKIYGNGGGMVPELNSVDREDDLVENAIEVRDFNNNNILDGDDQILFYAQPPDEWVFNEGDKTYRHVEHLYSDFTYYFITYGGALGKRVTALPSGGGLSANNTVNSFDGLFYHEVNTTNLIRSGREWYGEEFDINTKSRVFNDAIIPYRITGEEIVFRTEVVGRSLNTSNFSIRLNGQQVVSRFFTAVSGDYEDAYIDTPAEDEMKTIVASPNIQVGYTYNFSGANSLGWLNYYEIISRRQLVMTGGQMGYQDSRALDFTTSEFEFNPNGQGVILWDVTNPLDVKLQQTYPKGGNVAYKVNTNIELKKYWAFNNADFYAPAFEGKVTNQNLHALGQIDFVIVSGEEFLSEANRLADFHIKNNGLQTVVVTPQQLYNEFSSGAQDISAIRDFMKMFYDRAANLEEQPKYLLLFGDASFDYKGYLQNNAFTVPTYESRNSYLPVKSYCSDDYYGFLDDTEGLWINDSDHKLDIGIGRLPVRSIDDARNIVNKIIHYKSTASFGDWRSNLLVMADDEDTNEHQYHARTFIEEIEANNPQMNIRKLYVDAYKEQSLAIGKRYPDVTQEINDQINKGLLLFNYSGHGGEQGLGHERYITIPQINNWSNYDKLPVFVTATCEFTRFDDPTKVSPGELIMSNPQGGGIGLFTTVRLVYAHPNRRLNLAMFEDNLFELRDGSTPTYGDVMKDTKNNAPADDNNRNFSFIGDPALVINLPRYNVETTSINGNAVGGNDTIKALQKVTFTGKVTDDNGSTLTDFNGVVYPTVYDKKVFIKTLVNNPPGTVKDPSYPDSFYVYKNVLYKGKAEVVNGLFSFTFVVPKDISFKYGNGRVSYYADNSVTDAIGFYDQFVIGGSSDSAADDKQGPKISLFMNDESFVFGGITNEDPVLLVKLKDENGINTVGNGIGREILAKLDEGSEEVEDEYVLNDFYEAKLNSYQEGEIRYQLEDLAAGRHTLSVKVWDVYNNSSEAYTEFVVAEDAKLALEHVLNYPNPFTTNTTFHFDHNKAGQDLQVQVQIMTVSGKIVKTINTNITAANTHIGDIKWDGKDEYGDLIGKGVYVYRVTVKSADGQKTDEIEKLVILK